MGVHREPESPSVGGPQFRSDESQDFAARRFHLIFAVLTGVPVTEWELKELDAVDAQELLDKIVEIKDRAARN